MGGSQVCYEPVDFATLVQYGSFIAVGRFLPTTTQKQHLFPPTASFSAPDQHNATPRQIPPFTYVTRDFQISQVLKGNGLQAQQTISVCTESAERSANDHLLYYAHDMMESPIVERYNGPATMTRDDVQAQQADCIVFLSKSDMFQCYAICMIGGVLKISELQATKDQIAKNPSFDNLNEVPSPTTPPPTTTTTTTTTGTNTCSFV